MPIGFESNSEFCLLRINIDGEDVLPSSVKWNSLNRIVLPTLPVNIVSPSFGFKNLIPSLMIYSGFFSFCAPALEVDIPVSFCFL